MADTSKQAKVEDGRPESPTTAQPLDFEDDQDGPATSTVAAETKLTPGPVPPPKDETPPTKPARPLNPREQAESTLREAFPSIDRGVVRAVLSASGGQLEPAFNALLEMTDPDAATREAPAPPAMPPRPVRGPTSTQQSQLDADEQYARQLAQHYDATGEQKRPAPKNKYNETLQGSRPGRPGAHPDPDDYHWRSFVDDDLPEIGENIRKGFLETQKTVNGWLSNFKKQFDGDEDEDFQQPPPKPARRSGDYARRSADMARYDADPQVIGDDFSKLDLRDGDHPPRTSSRPAANPNLFRPSLNARKSSPASGRKVSFQEGPPEEIRDMYSSSPKPSTIQTPSTTTKASKWQPLSKIDPSPVAENDPFSLGDSDDEKDAKPISMKDEEADLASTFTTDADKKDASSTAKEVKPNTTK